MNKHQLFRYHHDTRRKAELLHWHIDTILDDLKVFKMIPERQEYWITKVKEEKEDLAMFVEEMSIIEQQFLTMETPK